jgi:signal transduction histidine kinase/ActR/RegA family two-component response regulator
MNTRTWSIKIKLIAILLLTTFIALAVGLAAFSWFQITAYNEAMLEETTSLGEVISLTSRAAVAFNDPEAAKRSLESLRPKANIVGATIYSADGSLFAHYQRDPGGAILPPNNFHRGDTILDNPESFSVTRAIELHGEDLGTLLLVSDYEKLSDQLSWLLSLAVGVLLATMLVAVLIASIIQRIISQPILELVTAVKKVSDSKDYSLRVRVESSDELGVLNQNFNEMLQQIQTRDEELVSARDRAESADRAKSLFLANMSHEIHTPMNGIMGMTQVLLSLDGTEQQKECLEIVMSCADNLISLISDLLDFAKIEAGRFQIVPGKFELRRYLDQTAIPLRAMAQRSGCILSVSVNEDVPDILIADFRRVHQVITNLVGNSVKFSGTGAHVKINVECDQSYDDEITVRVTVSDEGIGIAPIMHEQIFEAFTQADASITRKYGGTGLGLSICKELVSAMGGSIGVQSEEGKGAIFTFTFQAVLASEVDSYEIEDHEHIVVLAKLKHFRDISVLVADDNPVSRKLMELYLRKAGFSVRCVTNGQEAVQAAKESKFDIICMDCQMPELDGFRATEAIRELEIERGLQVDAYTPVIALTAFTMRGDRERCLAAGMDRYIPKPVLMRELYQVLLELLQAKQQNQ